MKFCIAVSLVCASALTFHNSSEKNDTIEASNNSSDVSRKHYGLSFNVCPDFIMSFRCMSACKSIGFQIFRLDHHCKCTCHIMKTTTILPFFKWRTNGSTKAYPRTQSVGLYHIAGTLSPATEWEPPVPTTEAPVCVYLTTSNTTGIFAEDGSGNGTETGDGTDVTQTGDTAADGTTPAATDAAPADGADEGGEGVTQS